MNGTHSTCSVCGLAPGFHTAGCQERRTRGDRQRDIVDWAVSMFGDIAKSRLERAARLLEEAAEAAQAAGLGPDIAGKIIARVYEGKPGDPHQELGDAAIALEAMAEVEGVNVEDLTRSNWERVRALPKERCQASHAAKVRAGIAGQR